jgi:3-hydroxyisobutyrate dehydrogenase
MIRMCKSLFSSSSSSSSSSSRFRVLCVGLGNMGFELADRISKRHDVWTSDPEVRNLPGDAVGVFERGAVEVDVVLTCLPNSNVVRAVYDNLLKDGVLRENTIWIDCTSGDPSVSQSLARISKENHGAIFLDCAVSGGPAGARRGTLTTMMGGDEDAIERVRPIIQTFASNVNTLGPTGAGHAVKAMNNTLLAAHICAASEALVGLKQFGVKPSDALKAINTSSGRSWVTQQRVPDHVLTRKFDYGFSLANHLKDVRLGVEMLGDTPSPLLRQVETLLDIASKREVDDTAVDHLFTMKLAEDWAGGVKIED